MRHSAVAAGLVGLSLLACGAWLHQRGLVEEQTNRASATDSPFVQTPTVVVEGGAVAARSDAAPDPAAIDLRDAPQTFRNSTLLFAIRRAGFYCADVVSASESAEGVWVASCSEPIGHYIVGLRGLEQFDVHQVGFVDSVAPAIVDFDRQLKPGSPEPQLLRK